MHGLNFCYLRYQKISLYGSNLVVSFVLIALCILALKWGGVLRSDSSHPPAPPPLDCTDWPYFGQLQLRLQTVIQYNFFSKEKNALSVNFKNKVLTIKIISLKKTFSTNKYRNHYLCLTNNSGELLLGELDPLWFRPGHAPPHPRHTRHKVDLGVTSTLLIIHTHHQLILQIEQIDIDYYLRI